MRQTLYRSNRHNEDKERLISETFPGLDIKAFKMLALQVYMNEEKLSSPIVRFLVNQGLGEQDISDCRLLLERSGYLNPRWYFKIVFFLMEHYGSLISSFAKARLLRFESAIYLWNLAECLFGRDFRKASSLPRPTSFNGANPLAPYIAPLILTESYGGGTAILSRVEVREAVRTILLDALMEDCITEEMLLRLEMYLRGKTVSDDELYDQIATYRYYAFGPVGGIPPHPHGQPTLWSQACHAMFLLYRGDVFQARAKFVLATAGNRVSDIRDRYVFHDPLLTFFHWLCTYKSSFLEKTSSIGNISEAVALFKNSPALRSQRCHLPTSILVTYISSSTPDTKRMVSADIRQMMQNAPPYIASMAYLLSRYFRSGLDKEMPALIEAGHRIPSAAILRHELSPYLMMGFEQKDNLSHLYGGPPVLASVLRQDSWETALIDIQHNVLATSESHNRIAYFIEGMFLRDICRQEKDETGEWSPFEPLNRDLFLKCGYGIMNDADRKLAGLMRDNPGVPDAALVLSCISAGDRVFTGRFHNSSAVPVKVEVIRPYVQFRAFGTSIEVSSNVETESDGRTVPKCTLQGYHDGTWYLVSLNDLQHEFLSRILPVKTFPVSALDRIKQLAERLSGLIEVRSELALAEAMPRINGSDNIVVRITPKEGDYEVELFSRPVPEGELSLPPGEGEETVFDREGGITKLVTRNLRGEFEVYNAIRKEIETTGAVFSAYQAVSLSNPDSLLKLLTFTWEYQDRYIVEWPEGQQLRFRGILNPSDIDIQVKSNVKWFDMVGKVKFVGSGHLNLETLLKRFREAGDSDYIRIGDREYMKMTKALKKHLAELEAIALPSKGGEGVIVPQYRIGSLAQVLGDEGGLGAEMDEGFNYLLEKMENAYSICPEVPDGLKATLRPYQKEGYDWLVRLSSWGAGACLADDMGLGKTVQTLAFLLHRKDLGPSLIVAPKSVVPNWAKECRRFTPGLNPILLNEENNRAKVIDGATSGDVIIITYGILVTQIEKLQNVIWNVVCLDEAHQIKNRNTRCSAASMMLRAQHRMALTGTPIQNHLGELWNLFQFINPGMLGPWQHFYDRYINTEFDLTRQERLRSMTSPFILRRTKEDVLDDLPEKISYTHMVELTDDEMAVYEDERLKANDAFDGKRRKKGEKANTFNFFEMLTRLRLLANSVSLVHADWKPRSSKVSVLLEILENTMSVSENRVLVFSQFTSLLEQVRNALDKRMVQYLYLDGQTPLPERESLVDRFQTGGEQLFLISLKAGGLGLNLTAANYVILMDPWWNPAIENQATDRAHRIGQKRTVTVIRMVSAQTIEERILKLHETKKDLADKMLDGTADSGKLTMDDILDLISPNR